MKHLLSMWQFDLLSKDSQHKIAREVIWFFSATSRPIKSVLPSKVSGSQTIAVMNDASLFFFCQGYVISKTFVSSSGRLLSK